ncbi:hypothetical protein [Phytohabitans rumicis]|uniref:Uncharacterized protein n=1 Tax=Phytohabitans rumicis TaxID=1076125 RepID=A0A6V8L1R3_9ACTN|nr:hypothetical protein [Phytohabitans rumicis]GFJ88047.1 hypothetical protein Prum_016890 [Phytohabitans rumicis]
MDRPGEAFPPARATPAGPVTSPVRAPAVSPAAGRAADAGRVGRADRRVPMGRACHAKQPNWAGRAAPTDRPARVGRTRARPGPVADVRAPVERPRDAPSPTTRWGYAEYAAPTKTPARSRPWPDPPRSHRPSYPAGRARCRRPAKGVPVGPPAPAVHPPSRAGWAHLVVRACPRDLRRLAGSTDRAGPAPPAVAAGPACRADLADSAHLAHSPDPGQRAEADPAHRADEVDLAARRHRAGRAVLTGLGHPAAVHRVALTGRGRPAGVAGRVVSRGRGRPAGVAGRVVLTDLGRLAEEADRGL